MALSLLSRSVSCWEITPSLWLISLRLDRTAGTVPPPPAPMALRVQPRATLWPAVVVCVVPTQYPNLAMSSERERMAPNGTALGGGPANERGDLPAETSAARLVTKTLNPPPA